MTMFEYCENNKTKIYFHDLFFVKLQIKLKSKKKSIQSNSLNQ